MTERKHREDECFGLPNGGAIAGIIFGLLIIIWGFSLATGIDLWGNIFYIIVIIFGALIIAGSAYKLRRR
ncbi:MAG: hypothetical protein JSV58_01190 [Candidatus Bathyarchaeota archaeon]|nr:MAG: hypothetical protein JSV58_01190 [Candidatus Bathyarchaeota archaeon]